MQLLYKFHIFYRYFDANISANEIHEFSFATKRFMDICSTENDQIYRITELSLQYYLTVGWMADWSGRLRQSCHRDQCLVQEFLCNQFSQAVTGWSNIFDQLGGPDSRLADWSGRLRQVISLRPTTYKNFSVTNFLGQ